MQVQYFISFWYHFAYPSSFDHPNFFSLCNVLWLVSCIQCQNCVIFMYFYQVVTPAILLLPAILISGFFYWRTFKTLKSLISLDRKELISKTLFSLWIFWTITSLPYVIFRATDELQVWRDRSELSEGSFYFMLWSVCPGWGRARNRLWSDRPRQVGPLIRPSQTEVTSDQTSMRSKIIVRSKCARSRLWLDEFQIEVTPDQTSSRPLSRQVPDHCPD